MAGNNAGYDIAADKPFAGLVFYENLKN